MVDMLGNFSSDSAELEYCRNLTKTKYFASINACPQLSRVDRLSQFLQQGVFGLTPFLK